MRWPIRYGRCTAIAVLGVVAVMAGGCASQPRDLVHSGHARVQTVSTPQYHLDPPSIAVDNDNLVVAGTAHSLVATTRPASHQSDPPVHLLVSVLYPSGQVWQQFMVTLSPATTPESSPGVMAYSFRYFQPPPEGAVVLVGILDQNHEMVGTGGGGGGTAADASGNAGPGLVGYGAPGGAVFNRANVAQPSLSQRTYTAQTLGANRAFGRSSPGYAGSSGRR